MAERYEHTRGAVERTNCQIVLLADEGRHAPEIRGLVRRAAHQVRKVLRRFQAQDVADLAPHTAPGRALEVMPARLAELRRVIDLDPHSVDVPSAVWTPRLLSAYLERVTGHMTGIETVRIHLHGLGLKQLHLQAFFYPPGLFGPLALHGPCRALAQVTSNIRSGHLLEAQSTEPAEWYVDNRQQLDDQQHPRRRRRCPRRGRALGGTSTG